MRRFNIKIENIVASASLGVKISLEKIVEHLEGTEYEPEQFPGLVYRMKNPKVAFLLFSSGKVVCTGVRKIEDIEYALKIVTKRLKSISALRK